MTKKAIVFVVAALLAQCFVCAQTNMTVPYGSFEQWTTHSGYSTSGFLPIMVYGSYSTPTGWDYLTYPVNESFSMGVTITVNTDLPLIKASQESGGVPDGNSAVKLQTFMLSDIISSTVYNVAASSIDPQLVNEVYPSILSTGVVNIEHFIPIMNSMMSNMNNTTALLALLAEMDINYIITGGIPLGDFEPTYLSGSYKYHSAVEGDNGGVVILGTRYNTTLHKREVVGGGVNIALTDCSGYTPFTVDYISLHEYNASYAEQTPDSLIIMLVSSASTNRQQGSYLCIDNLDLWHVDPPEPDTCASITALSAVADIHEAVITWSTTAAVDSVELEYGVAGFEEGQGTILGPIADTGVSTLTLSGLDADMQYDVRVRSVCTNGAYSDWATVSFTTLLDTCASIIALSAVADIHEAVLSWNTTAAVDSVELEYGVAGFETGHGTVIRTDSSTLTISGLDASTQYDAYVRSSCANGAYSEWVTVSFTTLADTNTNVSIVNTENGLGNRDLLVYPNPAHGQCQVDLSDVRNAELRLYSSDGRLLQVIRTEGPTCKLQLPTAGVYLLQVVSSDGAASLKIVNGLQ